MISFRRKRQETIVFPPWVHPRYVRWRGINEKEIASGIGPFALRLRKWTEPITEWFTLLGAHLMFIGILLAYPIVNLVNVILIHPELRSQLEEERRLASIRAARAATEDVRKKQSHVPDANREAP